MIEVFEHMGSDYMPLVEYQGWRVAVLRHSERFSSLSGWERHTQTDEVFVLLEGSAELFNVENGKTERYEMEHGKIYNVPKNVWHHIVVSEDASVLIVENSDTCAGNTERKEI